MKVDIKSGFGRGGKILRWAGGEIIPVKTVAENTWQGDGDDSFSGEIPDGQYIIGTYHTSGHTRVWHWELHGFPRGELNSPAPVCGWRTEDVGCRATKVTRVDTLGDWLIAEAGGDFLPDSKVIAGATPHPTVPGLRLARLPYEWGDQSAEHWAVYRDGELIGEACGCGDRTPEPVVTADGWVFDDAAERRRIALQEEDDARNAMLDRGTVGEWAEVGRHIASCYRRNLNPLPTLRREHGGKWQFVASDQPDPVTATGIMWQGDGWTVIHTPAA